MNRTKVETVQFKDLSTLELLKHLEENNKVLSSNIENFKQSTLKENEEILSVLKTRVVQ